tara:strand:+ start:1155 stop:2351 length:1197 start_codon:yes stop_codon:yes gene_type:complete
LAFVKLTNCLACGSKKLKKVLDLNDQPLANSYLKNKKIKEKKYELKVNCCLSCHHLQLSVAVDPKKIYQKYDYVSGTTKTYTNYMKDFYKFSIKNIEKVKYKNILDIGCNDGSQLDIFKKKGFKTYGVDPAKNIYKISSKKHKVICGFFNKKIVEKINKKFDIIIFQNSFAHNPNPKKLLTNVKKLMHIDSTLIIQTSQADMCKNKEFDTVYHEHINFFNINSMNKLLKRVNLKLHYVTKKSIHGSSYLFVIKFHSNQKKIIQSLKDEKFLKYKYYDKWGTNCLKSVRKIKEKIDHLKKTNIVVGYGAAAKANTFINFSRVKFDFIIDDNNLKQNKYCPGSKIPIKSINALKKIKQNIVIVPLAWNFYSEIKSKVIKSRKNRNDKFLVCFPKLRLDRV